MSFNKLNFIAPLNTGDKILRIRNSSNNTVYMIKESTATLKVVTKYIYIKQSFDANMIILDFSSNDEALAASILLRNALDQLSINIGVSVDGNKGSGWKKNNSSTGSEIFEIGFNPSSNSTLGIDYTFNVSAPINNVIGFYVDGILIDNNVTNFFTYVPSSTSPTVFVWKSSATFILETSDVITILYTIA